MDYEEATELMLRHEIAISKAHGAVAKHSPTWKRLGNKTWLVKESAVIKDADDFRHNVSFALRLFQKEIIVFRKTQMDLDDHGYFGHTTHQRFNKYLPRGWHVRGQTIQSLGKGLGPVGFVKTPKGTFPYNMPMHFHYDGTPIDDSYSSMSDQVIYALGAYVNEAVDALLSGKLSDTSGVFYNTKTFAELVLSSGISREVLERVLLQEGVLDNRKSVSADDVKLLIAYGSQVFKKPRTRSDVALRTEATLLIGEELPQHNYSTLRGNLRSICLRTITQQLGFVHHEWNRR